MTQIFDEQGLAIPVTVIKVDDIVVTQVKTVETDGYNAIQVGTIAAKEKHLTKAQLGHFKKNNLENFRHLQEFRVDNPSDYKVGDKIELSILNNVEKVDVTGKSIGKGFQGTVKRWNFGRGPMGHGSKNHREPGSIGAGTTPSRVIKGKRMAGNMGNERVTITKLTTSSFKCFMPQTSARQVIAANSKSSQSPIYGGKYALPTVYIV